MSLHLYKQFTFCPNCGTSCILYMQSARFQNQIVEYLPSSLIPPGSYMGAIPCCSMVPARKHDHYNGWLHHPTPSASLIYLKRSVRRDRNTSIRISRSRKYKTMPITRAHLFDIWILKVFFGQWGVYGLIDTLSGGTAQTSFKGWHKQGFLK